MAPLFSNILFVGGIHGVGKSTICRKLCKKVNIEYLSASQVLKWADINVNAKNKNVENISLTQDRLIRGLLNTVKDDKHYLLDGHYCLFDKQEKITRIPIETFIAINPMCMFLIVGEVDTIKSRIEERDQRNYSHEILKEMQEEEIIYAQELSKKLCVKLSVGQENDYSEILMSLERSVNK